MGKKNKLLSGWVVMVVGLVVAIGFGMGPALAADKSEAEEQIGEEVLGGGTVTVAPFDQEAVFDDSFGDKTQATFIPSWAFELDGSGQAWDSTGPAYSQRYSTTGVAWWNAPIRLPSGCRVTQVAFYYYCTSGSVTMTVYRENSPTSASTLLNYTYSSGGGWLTTYWNTSQRISNGSGWYFIRFNLDSSQGSGQRFWGARILWERDVRPGLSHPFTDTGKSM